MLFHRLRGPHRLLFPSLLLKPGRTLLHSSCTAARLVEPLRPAHQEQGVSGSPRASTGTVRPWQGPACAAPPRQAGAGRYPDSVTVSRRPCIRTPDAACPSRCAGLTAAGAAARQARASRGGGTSAASSAAAAPAPLLALSEPAHRSGRAVRGTASATSRRGWRRRWRGAGPTARTGAAGGGCSSGLCGAATATSAAYSSRWARVTARDVCGVGTDAACAPMCSGGSDASDWVLQRTRRAAGRADGALAHVACEPVGVGCRGASRHRRAGDEAAGWACWHRPARAGGAKSRALSCVGARLSRGSMARTARRGARTCWQQSVAAAAWRSKLGGPRSRRRRGVRVRGSGCGASVRRCGDRSGRRGGADC